MATAASIVHGELREQMKERDVETIVQRALEKLPGQEPRVHHSRFQRVHPSGGDYARADLALLSTEQRKARTVARQSQGRVHSSHRSGRRGGGAA